MQKWIADWNKTPFDGQPTGFNPVLERIRPIPSDNVTLMRSDPIRTYGSDSDYYLAALSVVIQ